MLSAVTLDEDGSILLCFADHKHPLPDHGEGFLELVALEPVCCFLLIYFLHFVFFYLFIVSLTAL